VLLADTSVTPILIEHYLSFNTGSSCMAVTNVLPTLIEHYERSPGISHWFAFFDSVISLLVLLIKIHYTGV
jgi:hypothetical protein